MRSRLYLGVLVAGLAVLASTAHAQDMVGVWKMNAAQSTFDPGPPYASATIQSEPADSGGYKTITERADAIGRVIREELAVTFDGMEHPVEGASVPTTRAYKWIDDHSFEYVLRRNGQIASTLRLAVSVDGKTLTATETDEQGRRDLIIYEK